MTKWPSSKSNSETTDLFNFIRKMLAMDTRPHLQIELLIQNKWLEDVWSNFSKCLKAVKTLPNTTSPSGTKDCNGTEKFTAAMTTQYYLSTFWNEWGNAEAKEEMLKLSRKFSKAIRTYFH